MFVPNIEEVTREWRKLHAELHNLYFSSTMKVRWENYVAHIGKQVLYIVMGNLKK
jgi:hypothetical protein